MSVSIKGLSVPHKAMALNDTKLKKEVNTDIAVFDFLTCQYGEDKATMYAWCFKYKGEYTIGRTYEQFSNFLSHFTRGSECYYLAYTADIRRFYTYFSGNVLNQRKKPIEVKIEPSKATSVEQYSQLTLNRLVVRDITKLVAIDMPKPTFDTTLIRHSQTPLTVEIDYLKARVDYIESVLLKYGITIETSWQSIQNKTRAVIKKHYDEMTDYEKVIHQNNTRVSEKQFNIIRNAVRGGVCMASADKIGVTLTNVRSFDAVSHYPTQLVYKKFPVKAILMDWREGIKLNSDYLYIAEVEFFNIRTRNENLPYWKCDIEKGDVVDGLEERSGNVFSAMYYKTTMTSVDMITFSKFYKWDSYTILNAVKFTSGYLPKFMIDTVWEMFNAKEATRGTPQGTINKAGLNSIWGLTSSRYETWKSYDMKRNRLFFCAWGAFITAYARKELLDRIIEVGNDFVYCDTDSIKCINGERYTHLFDLGNELGQWKDEGNYEVFKTLGKKKYACVKNGVLDVTFSGLNKEFVLSSVMDKELFVDTLRTGCTLQKAVKRAYIIHEKIHEIITDHLGNAYTVYENRCLCERMEDFTIVMKDLLSGLPVC